MSIHADDGRNLNAADGGTALWLAAERGHAEAVETLARLGGDVNATAYPEFEGTPMFITVQEGHTVVIETLGRLRVDVNRAIKDGRTPVYMATAQGHMAAIEALGANLGKLSADMNRDSNASLTPLALATSNGQAAPSDEQWASNGQASDALWRLRPGDVTAGPLEPPACATTGGDGGGRAIMVALG